MGWVPTSELLVNGAAYGPGVDTWAIGELSCVAQNTRQTRQGYLENSSHDPEVAESADVHAMPCCPTAQYSSYLPAHEHHSGGALRGRGMQAASCQNSRPCRVAELLSTARVYQYINIIAIEH